MSDELPALLSIEKARHYAADPPLGRGTAYQYARDGTWKVVRVGRRLLAVRSSIDAWVEQAEQEDADGA